MSQIISHYSFSHTGFTSFIIWMPAEHIHISFQTNPAHPQRSSQTKNVFCININEIINECFFKSTILKVVSRRAYKFLGNDHSALEKHEKKDNDDNESQLKKMYERFPY